MKVYRYLSEIELKSILSNNMSNVGYEYANNPEFQQSNNHRYKIGIKYLHFFKAKADCRRVKSIHNNDKTNFYIAEFNIPFVILAKHIGCGFYNTIGYDIDYDKIIEFAVPANKIKADYLISFEPTKNNYQSKNYAENTNYLERS